MDLLFEFFSDLFGKILGSCFESRRVPLWIKSLLVFILCIGLAVLFAVLAINYYRDNSEWVGTAILGAISLMFAAVWICFLIKFIRNRKSKK